MIQGLLDSHFAVRDVVKESLEKKAESILTNMMEYRSNGDFDRTSEVFAEKADKYFDSEIQFNLLKEILEGNYIKINNLNV